MSESGQGSLTELARSIQTRNQQFQQELTEAAARVVSEPTTALARFEHARDQADRLEQDELELLAQMGDWGLQQIQQTNNSWKQNRLQILLGKTQVLIVLGRYDDAQSVIDSARLLITDSADPAAMMLDELEVTIIQAKA